LQDEIKDYSPESENRRVSATVSSIMPTFSELIDPLHSMSEGGDDLGVTFERAVGFIDWAHCFPGVPVMWQVIGTLFFTVVFISFLPQTTELVTSRSSFGIESIAIFCQSLGHFLLVVNLLSFHAYDFVGFFQYPTMRAFPRIITFFNLFFQWILFLPTVLQLSIYHDREIREARGQEQIRSEWYKTCAIGICLTLVDLTLVSIFVGLATFYNFETQPICSYAEICGTISTVLEIGFFLPQMYTTCKLKDGGSLSLLMLEIQAPADLANSLYMWLGTGDHWTTWLCVLVNAAEEFTLLGTCLLFKCLKARQAMAAAAELKRSKSILASIEAEHLDFGMTTDDSATGNLRRAPLIDEF
jgi:uncharacterized protein with PQ loop repeat